jgi:hypothetical protein
VKEEIRVRSKSSKGSKLGLLIFWGGAAFLAPWIIILFITQRGSGIADHLRLVQEGIALCLLAGLILTAYLAAHRSDFVLLSAVFCGTLAFITAWFGTVSAKGAAFWFLFAHAVVVLLPIIVLSCWVVAVTFKARGAGSGFPRWVPIAYVVAAVVVAPLIVLGAIVVHPDRAVDHLRLLWTGLDCFELAFLVASGVLLWQRSSAVAMTAMCLGTLMFADAWFNILAVSGTAVIAAILMACGELPLSVFAVYAAYHEVNSWSRLPVASPGTG